MKLWPDDKRDLILVTLLLWIPIAFSLLIGTQGAHSQRQALQAVALVAVVTLVLLAFAVAAVRRKPKTR